MDSDAYTNELNAEDLVRLSRLALEKLETTIGDWLSTPGTRRCLLAIQILQNAGRDPATVLLYHALAPRLSPSRRIGFLGTLERLGKPLTVTQWMDLQFAMHKYDRPIQEAMARVLGSNRSAGGQAG